MLFWKKPEITNIDEITAMTFSILASMKQFGRYLSPDYLVADSKSNAKRFELSIDSVRDILDKSVNKEGGKSFPELGRTFGFFSSLDDDLSSGITINIGASHPRIKNSIVVNLPISNVLISEKDIFAFETLFKQIVIDFTPFWACVYSSKSSKKFGKLWSGSKPVSTQWMNYFDTSVVQSIGESRIKELRGIEELNGGYYFKLFSELFDANNPEHERLQEKANIALGLQGVGTS
jgi:hypothetical protein